MLDLNVDLFIARSKIECAIQRFGATAYRDIADIYHLECSYSIFFTVSTNTDSENDDAQSRSKEGQRAGIRNWSETHTDVLLDIVAEIRPSGRKQWERVALRLHAFFIEPR